MITLTRVIEFYEESCCACGVAFMIPNLVYVARKRDKKQFHCPNGHAQSYTRSTEDDLRDQLAASERETVAMREQADEALLRVSILERRLKRRPRL